MKHTQNELIKRIKSLRPWYAWLTYLPFTPIFILAPVIFLFFSNAVSLFQKFTGVISEPVKNQTETIFTTDELHVLSTLFIGLLFFTGALLDKLRNYLFPKVFFCIGRQEKEYKKRQRLRYTIFGVIVLGIIINIASTIIYEKF